MKMKTMTVFAAAQQLAASATAAPAVPPTTAPIGSEFSKLVDKCLAANARTEFDTLAAVATHVSESCNGLTGTVRIKGRADTVNGDVLRYDPEGRRLVWQTPLTLSNRFGGTYSPYDYNPVLRDPSIPKAESIALRAAWDWSYWLIPAEEMNVREENYTARNGFGAETLVHRRQSVRYGLAVRIPPKQVTMTALLIPMEPEVARGIIDRLDVVLTWSIAPGCSFCYRAGTKVTGFAPTFQSPTEERIENRFLFVQISRIQVIDRVTGQVIQDAVPNNPR